MADGLLVDTCAAIWILEDAELSSFAITAMDDAFDLGRPVFVSTITAWELGMLASRNRLSLGAEPHDLFGLLLSRAGFKEQPLRADVAIASSYLPGDPPRDPFDRIIIATARAHDLTILTRDRLTLSYADAGHVSALAC
ncbi:PIN domain-containing protein [Chthonobacter rhizosphaerae]|uniref:PIN domain-containing protein n=1 Tax=Chthonobacter rhizosphaerae TaxID=2735553 RepID=UPI0015EFCB46